MLVGFTGWLITTSSQVLVTEQLKYQRILLISKWVTGWTEGAVLWGGGTKNKMSLLCLYKTQTWFCVLWFLWQNWMTIFVFCVLRSCVLCENDRKSLWFWVFLLVFCVRHKHKTSFWCKFRVLTSYLSRKPFASC